MVEVSKERDLALDVPDLPVGERDLFDSDDAAGGFEGLIDLAVASFADEAAFAPADAGSVDKVVDVVGVVRGEVLSRWCCAVGRVGLVAWRCGCGVLGVWVHPFPPLHSNPPRGAPISVPAVLHEGLIVHGAPKCNAVLVLVDPVEAGALQEVAAAADPCRAGFGQKGH